MVQSNRKKEQNVRRAGGPTPTRRQRFSLCILLHNRRLPVHRFLILALLAIAPAFASADTCGGVYGGIVVGQLPNGTAIFNTGVLTNWNPQKTVTTFYLNGILWTLRNEQIVLTNFADTCGFDVVYNADPLFTGDFE